MLEDNTLFERSKTLVPGGVHSPVRSFRGLGRPPLFMEKGRGAYLYDTTGKNFIDFCMSFGPLILGHADSDVQEALEGQLKKGWSYGTCETYSLELAEFLVSQLPGVQQIRFVSSGTEAVMTALRLARGFTGRNKIVKFNGCYHGHTDSMLIKAGSGLAGMAQASSAGVPSSVAGDTLILELGDIGGLEECFNKYPGQIAAVIIEPLPANSGLLIQENSFLQRLRELTLKNGSLLIFDEVISGFRTGFTGMAGKTGIAPDLFTYGKIIGGGLPVGAVAGNSTLMESLAPVGEVYQAGTLSANPLAMVGGMTTLKKMTSEAYLRLESYSKEIVAIFRDWLQNYDSGRFQDIAIIHRNSLFWFHPRSQQPLSRACDIPSDLSSRFCPLFNTLLEKGIYLSPNGYEVGFVSLAHDFNVQKELKERLWN